MQYNTVKSYLIEYWKAGREKNGLLPRYYKCGARGFEKKVSTEKRGRPRKYGSNRGVNITNEIKRKFTIGLNR
ncbi:hypothetical protein JQK62_25210, partial [Leptospira santarosai]|nr:hypothetical protein [Leptospira santarosai]